jgi:hypothetical protein
VVWRLSGGGPAVVGGCLGGFLAVVRRWSGGTAAALGVMVGVEWADCDLLKV